MQCKGMKQEAEKGYLPAEKAPYLSLRFHDTYTYYYIPENLLAFVAAAPHLESIPR